MAVHAAAVEDVGNGDERQEIATTEADDAEIHAPGRSEQTPDDYPDDSRSESEQGAGLQVLRVVADTPVSHTDRLADTIPRLSAGRHQWDAEVRPSLPPL